MSARRQRPPWYNCSKLGCVSFEARRQRESCRSTDAPSGISLSTALEDCGPASCVRKTADSLEPPRYRCKGNVLLMTWPSYCFPEKLIIAPQVGEFLPPLNAGTCIRPAGSPTERGAVLAGAQSPRLALGSLRSGRSFGRSSNATSRDCESEAQACYHR